MHDRFRPARSTAALSAAFALALVAAPVFAAPVVNSTANAAAGSPSEKAADKVDKSALIVPQSAETILGEIQQQLAIVMGKSEPPLEHVEALSRALFAARGGVTDRAAIGDLAGAVATVIARGSLPGELLERLAQNLFAAASPRKLTPQEASLLALDVALLLQESGGTAEDVASVLTPMQRLCPGAALPGGGKLPKTTTAQRPAPRVLSVLTRPSSGS